MNSSEAALIAYHRSLTDAIAHAMATDMGTLRTLRGELQPKAKAKVQAMIAQGKIDANDGEGIAMNLRAELDFFAGLECAARAHNIARGITVARFKDIDATAEAARMANAIEQPRRRDEGAERCPACGGEGGRRVGTDVAFVDCRICGGSGVVRTEKEPATPMV